MRLGVWAWIAALFVSTSAFGQTVGAHMNTYGATRAPMGWVQFCEARPWECAEKKLMPTFVVVDAKKRLELAWVNNYVNEKIKPLTDLEHYGAVERWTYPDDGYGDCEDYALLKKRMLMQRGWPEAALLITVVRDQYREGHAVLMVTTIDGDFVLDNQVKEILPWHETQLRFVKRQSATQRGAWVDLSKFYDQGDITSR